MSSKRKSDAKPQQAKRGRKKKVDEDFESDGSDDNIGNGKNDGNNDGSSTEVLIAGDGADTNAKLPEELLKTYDREPGKLMIAGMVTWELTGRRDPKGKVTNIRPNLYVFHRFTNETVRIIFYVNIASN